VASCLAHDLPSIDSFAGSYIAEFLLESLKGRDQLEDLGIDGRIILKCRTSGVGGVHCIHVAQDVVHWRASVNMAINLRVS